MPSTAGAQHRRVHCSKPRHRQLFPGRSTRPRLQSRGTLVTATIALAVGVLASVLLMADRPADASGSPGWLVTCTAVHSLQDDPVVHPGMSGMSHLHDFIGNPTTISDSTYTSMTSATSGCVLPSDTAGYWVPALYRNGVKIKPGGAGVREQIYYRANNLVSGTKVMPFPADLRMVAGNSMATSATQNPKLGKEIYWGCSDNSTGKLIAPPPSCATGIVTLHVGFPNCWDGVLTHSNDTAHLAYPKSGYCPSGFPRALPRVIERWEYPVGTRTGTVTLSSGAPYTAHGDFWNTWNQTRLVSLVAYCLNKNIDCGKPTS